MRIWHTVDTWLSLHDRGLFNVIRMNPEPLSDQQAQVGVLHFKKN
jgi:hypothetical protein